MSNSELEERVNILEQQVEILGRALSAVTQLSTTPTIRQFPAVKPIIHGTEQVAAILKEGGLMPEDRKSSEERVREMLDRGGVG